MAWWESVKSQLNSSEEKDFYADAAADVADLPKMDDGIAPGSTCLVIATSDVYMLDSTDTWKVL